MKELIELIKGFVSRLKIESPDIFKKVQKWSVISSSIIGILLIGNGMLGWDWGLVIIPWINCSVTALLGGAVALITGVFITSKTPVKEPMKLKSLDTLKNEYANSHGIEPNELMTKDNLITAIKKKIQ